MKTPHKHAFYIKAWADGAEIQVQLPSNAWASIGESPSWLVSNVYRVKPERRTLTVENGIATLEDGSTVNLLDIQGEFLHFPDAYRAMMRITGLKREFGVWVPATAD